MSVAVLGADRQRRKWVGRPPAWPFPHACRQGASTNGVRPIRKLGPGQNLGKMHREATRTNEGLIQKSAMEVGRSWPCPLSSSRRIRPSPFFTCSESKTSSSPVQVTLHITAARDPPKAACLLSSRLSRYLLSIPLSPQFISLPLTLLSISPLQQGKLSVRASAQRASKLTGFILAPRPPLLFRPLARRQDGDPRLSTRLSCDSQGVDFLVLAVNDSPTLRTIRHHALLENRIRPRRMVKYD